MKIEEFLNPYSVPSNFRAYAYDKVVLAKETNRVSINTSTFDKSALLHHCGLNVLMVEDLNEVQLHDFCQWPEGEFLIFHKGNDAGYVVLFKRLRDTFAHGHYALNGRDTITIRHRYKGRGEKEPNTRAFGNLQITTLKKLVAFLDKTNDDPI